MIMEISKNTPKTQNILLVEDNPADILLTREAFKEGTIPHNMTAVNDGVEAVSYLKRAGKYADAVRPDIILLDINLPKKNGFEVLAEIKQDQDLKHIPAIVLSTSGSKHDIRKAYELHANCYLIKPVELEDFLRVIRSLEDFWFNVAAIP
jgi:two-component system, chemotaxis family, response regulator Rcp1